VGAVHIRWGTQGRLTEQDGVYIFEVDILLEVFSFWMLLQ
jgi:hypothetical protein